MRISAIAVLLATSCVLAGACRSAPPPPPTPLRALGDSAAAALTWVQSHAQPLALSDSGAAGNDRARIAALAGDARIVGVSELTEGTREFPLLMRHLLFTLADSLGYRALVIQAPMAEAMEVDRYVRTGTGDIRRLLSTLGNWRWENRDMLELVGAIRDWNRTHPAERQIGFYGFEIPSVDHAMHVVTSLPESVTGAALKAWLARQYECVSTSESAHWGLEGRPSDSTFWNQCGVAAKAALDSVVALRGRLGAGAQAADLAFAEEMARVVEHGASVALRHATRHEGNADHLLFLANMLGADAKLLVWGGDVEMGRLTLDKTTVQTGVPLGARLGERYRPVAFMVGDGTVRTRRVGGRRGIAGSGLSDVALASPLPDTYEEVLIRAPLAAGWLDGRTLPATIGGQWLKGPRPARLVTESYVPDAPELTQTTVELPAFFDAVLYVRHVTPARQ